MAGGSEEQLIGDRAHRGHGTAGRLEELGASACEVGDPMGNRIIALATGPCWVLRWPYGSADSPLVCADFELHPVANGLG